MVGVGDASINYGINSVNDDDDNGGRLPNGHSWNPLTTVQTLTLTRENSHKKIKASKPIHSSQDVFNFEANQQLHLIQNTYIHP